MAQATADGSAPRSRPVVLGRHEGTVSYSFDLPFIISFIPIVAAATLLTQELFAGDWSFWTDWKDQQFWLLIAPSVALIIPAALQYIAWTGLRLPVGATVGAVCLFLAMWVSRSLNWQGFAYFPLNFVWPETFILGALIMDVTLLKTRSYVFTSAIGGGAWGVLFFAQQYPALAPFLQPVMHPSGWVLTVADVQGLNYVRAQTPEYLRIIEEGSLRAFLGDSTTVTVVFTATLCMGVYWVGYLIGKYLAVKPTGKYLPSLRNPIELPQTDSADHLPTGRKPPRPAPSGGNV